LANLTRTANYFGLKALYNEFKITSYRPKKGDHMAEPAGCARPTGKVLGDKPPAEQAPTTPETQKEMTMTARVGQKAPDFQAPAYYKGEFTSVKLSDHFGKWIVLCFYPGDFTYV
jgi:hypothetical protein